MPTGLLAALGEFTPFAPAPSSTVPGRLCWLPLLGVFFAFAVLLFYVPLAAVYLPGDVAAVLGTGAVTYLRGCKAEAEFARLADGVAGVRRRARRISPLGAAGTCVLGLAFLFRYAVLRFFLLPDAARLLAFATFAAFTAPSFVRRGGSWTAHGLGLGTLAAAAFLCLNVHGGSSVAWRAPTFCFALVYLAARLTFRVGAASARPNAGALPAELAAYLSFVVARYHFF